MWGIAIKYLILNGKPNVFGLSEMYNHFVYNVLCISSTAKMIFYDENGCMKIIIYLITTHQTYHTFCKVVITNNKKATNNFF